MLSFHADHRSQRSFFSPKSAGKKSSVLSESDDVQSVRSYHDEDAISVGSANMLSPFSAGGITSPSAIGPLKTLRPRPKLARDNSSSRLFSFNKVLQGKAHADDEREAVDEPQPSVPITSKSLHTPIRLPAPRPDDLSTTRRKLVFGSDEAVSSDAEMVVPRLTLSLFLGEDRKSTEAPRRSTRRGRVHSSVTSEDTGSVDDSRRSRNASFASDAGSCKQLLNVDLRVDSYRNVLICLCAMCS